MPQFDAVFDNPNIQPGIHSHGDGLIHTHPFQSSEAGTNATIGKFFSYGGWSISSDSIDLGGANSTHPQWAGPASDPKKTTWSAGDTCPFGRYKGEKVEMTWYVDGKEMTGNPADYHQQNGETRRRLLPAEGRREAVPAERLHRLLQHLRRLDPRAEQALALSDRDHPDDRAGCDLRDQRHHRHDRPGLHQHAVKAVVLVGGEGTRLRPLTYTTPKPLLPIANQPFLERQLSWLASYGVTEVVLSLGYLPDAFEQHFPTGRFACAAGDLLLRYAVEDHPLGTAGAIRFAAEALGDLDERIVVCNGDVLTTLDLGALVAFHDDRDAEATISLTQVVDPSAFGVVPTRNDGEVIAFVEKPPPGKAPDQLDQCGHLRARALGARAHPRATAVSIERETFPRMLEEPRRLYAKADDSYWIDIGTPEKYLQAHTDVLGGALRRRAGLRPAGGGRVRCSPACGCRAT